MNQLPKGVISENRYIPLILADDVISDKALLSLLTIVLMPNQVVQSSSTFKIKVLCYNSGTSLFLNMLWFTEKKNRVGTVRFPSIFLFY